MKKIGEDIFAEIGENLKQGRLSYGKMRHFES
jgi:hypothetical protein